MNKAAYCLLVIIYVSFVYKCYKQVEEVYETNCVYVIADLYLYYNDSHFLT